MIGRIAVVLVLGAGLMVANIPSHAVSAPADLRSAVNPRPVAQSATLAATAAVVGARAQAGAAAFGDRRAAPAQAAMATESVGRAIAAGSIHTCALTSAGRGSCWRQSRTSGTHQ